MACKQGIETAGAVTGKFGLALVICAAKVL
jgi:hypothetical protein